MYRVEVSPSLFSTVTDPVLEDVIAWQSRPLDAICPVVDLDAIHLKIRSEGHVQTLAVYLALGWTRLWELLLLLTRCHCTCFRL